MANNVIGLFENERVAERVVDDLVRSGFARSDITRFRGDHEDLEGELEREGVPTDEASYYVSGLREGGALVSVRAGEADTNRAVEIMNRYADAGGGARGDRADTGAARLEGVEEDLEAGGRVVDGGGGVQVRRVTSETPTTGQVTLREETVQVDRRSVDRPPEGSTVDPFTEQTFEFTETDEEAVVAKEARVVEEVVVDKDVVEYTQTVRDTVRRTEVEIEEVSGGRASPGPSDSSHVYGQTLASDARYAGRDWHDLEADARRDWEAQNEGGVWEEVRDRVREAWGRNRR